MSACQEIHVWQTNQQSWATNVATNLKSVDPTEGDIISANLYGDSKDELVYIKYKNTGSGKIEVHVWNETYQKWIANIATNHLEVDPLTNDVIAADVDGNGRDELVLVKYAATGSGRVETHVWGQNQQTWLTNIATNHGQVAY